MDSEIKKTISKRRKRTPKHMDYEDMLVIKEDPQSNKNALNINSNGPMVFIEYTDRDHNAIRYFDPRTRQYGRASVTNVKPLLI